MSVKSKTELLSLIDQIPVLPTAFLSHYVCQLYYTLNDALITVNDIKLQENPMSQSKEKEEDFTPLTTMKHSFPKVYRMEFLFLIFQTRSLPHRSVPCVREILCARRKMRESVLSRSSHVLPFRGEFHLRKLTPAAITISSRLKLQATLQKSYS